MSRQRMMAVGLATVLATAACAGQEQLADTTPTSGAPTSGSPTSTADEPGAQATPDPTVATSPTRQEGTSAPGETGAGTATVEADGERFMFRVIQCLRDVPGPMGDIVAFQLDGVPPDTSAELVEPLMGPVDPDVDIIERLTPVLDGGPILSVSRVADGGDVVALSTSLDTAFVTTADVTSTNARFLDISDSGSGATVRGTAEAATPDGGTTQLTVDAVCP